MALVTSSPSMRQQINDLRNTRVSIREMTCSLKQTVKASPAAHYLSDPKEVFKPANG